VVIIQDTFLRVAEEVEATLTVGATSTIDTNDKIHLMMNMNQFLNPT
jgi:hypothetical protein